MTDTKSGKRDIHLWWALGIALAAFFLRLWFVNFPTFGHMDEEITVNLSGRFVEQGILTADWAGFKNQWWSHPTYQFSPYTLVQSLITKLVCSASVSPPGFDRYILLARVTSCCWGGLAVLFVFFLGRTCFSPGRCWARPPWQPVSCRFRIRFMRGGFPFWAVFALSLVSLQTAKRPGSFTGFRGNFPAWESPLRQNIMPFRCWC